MMSPSSVYFVFPPRVLTTTHFTRSESNRRVFKRENLPRMESDLVSVMELWSVSGDSC